MKIVTIGCVESTICGAKNNRVLGPENILYSVRAVMSNQGELVGQQLVERPGLRGHAHYCRASRGVFREKTHSRDPRGLHRQVYESCDVKV